MTLASDNFARIEQTRNSFEKSCTVLVRKALIKDTKPFYTTASNGSIDKLDYYLALIKPKELTKAYRVIYFEKGYVFYKQEYNYLVKKYIKAESEEEFYSQMVVFFDKEIAKKITRVTETVKKNIRATLLNLMNKDSFSFADAIEYLLNMGLGFEPWRANRIARTEIVTASSQSRLLGAKATGLELNKVWITSIDGRERESHRYADGQIQKIDVDYIVGGERVRYPSDPRSSAKNRVNCRCADAFIPIED